MFYLKYRPKKINEIDNTLIREKLSSLLLAKKIPHALLFTGPKGTGKTSTARIIAKILNCTNKELSAGKLIEPCNNCESCRRINLGVSPDVIETDAASNRKIEETRNLIEQVKYAPLYSEYKIYIIDEVHMLTKESFNALLKTVEEPPQKTVFILATTEIDRVPKTIVSRCINLTFSKAQDNEIIRMLERIAKGENINLPREFFSAVARYADSSFRDGAKIFEEAVIQKALTVDLLNTLMGLRHENRDIIVALSKHDLNDVLNIIESYEKKGGNFKLLIEHLLKDLHHALLTKTGIEADTDKEINFTLPQITRLMKLFQEAYASLKSAPVESLPLEIAVTEYYIYKNNSV